MGDRYVPMSLLIFLAALAAPAAPTDAPERPVLRVCADPNNLPFSNRQGEGFENRIVELVAADLGAKLEYTWWAQRRGNIRETLNEKLCDLIPGVGSSMEMLGTTRPYYRSAYMIVTREGVEIDSLDDPRLRTMKIGVQMIGDDFSNTPPAHALARRGMIDNVRGYMVYGDYDDPSPQADIINDVAQGEIDAAFVWGPVAGYFGGRQYVPLRLMPVQPRFDGPQFPMLFDVSMGVRKEDRVLRARIDAVLTKRAPEIRKILESYSVPLVAE